jgi:hypothetical protein
MTLVIKPINTGALVAVAVTEYVILVALIVTVATQAVILISRLLESEASTPATRL